MRNLLCIIVILFASNVMAQNTGKFTDNRDGQTYKWVRIGNQIWMAENLRYKARGSGYYDLQVYGRIYDFKTAKKSCPSGWHLPSDSEWKIFERVLGMSEKVINSDYRSPSSNNIGFDLKSRSGWRPGWSSDGNGNGIDSYGFNALPGGYYHGYTKRFMHWGSSISFWSDTPVDIKNAIVRTLSSDNNSFNRDSVYKVHGNYCRCIKD